MKHQDAPLSDIGVDARASWALDHIWELLNAAGISFEDEFSDFSRQAFAVAADKATYTASKRWDEEGLPFHHWLAVCLRNEAAKRRAQGSLSLRSELMAARLFGGDSE